MGLPMTREPSETGELLERVRAGDAQALAELFGCYRDRLRAMVRLRLDRRLQGRIDPPDVELRNGETAEVLGLQKAAAGNRYVRALKRLKEILTGNHEGLAGYLRLDGVLP